MSDTLTVRTPSGALLRDRLEEYFRVHDYGVAITVDVLNVMSDGWETEVYSFTLRRNRQPTSYILRMYPGADAAEKSTREFHGMATLANPMILYPVPQVFNHETDLSLLGKPFIVMQRIDGQPLGDVMRENPARQPELLTLFCQLLIDLHRLDYHPFLAAQTDPSAIDLLRHKLTEGRRMIVDDFKQAWAIPIFEWLEAELADVQKTASLSVIHNDFHPWNILLTAEDQAYVIDWSLIEVNDYRFDLGWTLVLIATNGSLKERDLVLSEYERLAGHKADHIEYFEVVGTLRRLFDLSASLGSGAESLGMRPETVEIMRHQRDHYQQVYALLQQITGLSLPEIERLISSLGG